jgi:hypothetical protein
MPDLADVRRISMALPGVAEADGSGGQAAFSVESKGKWKGFAWSWMERVEPKKPRVARRDVLAIRVADLDDKEALLGSNGRALFTEPHYNGFPAVLVRLSEIELGELEELLVDGWRALAPAELVREYDGRTG